MTDNLLPLSREELDNLENYGKDHPTTTPEYVADLVAQAQTALDLQEALGFADQMYSFLEKDHILPRDLANVMCRYGQARSRMDKEESHE